MSFIDSCFCSFTVSICKWILSYLETNSIEHRRNWKVEPVPADTQREIESSFLQYISSLLQFFRRGLVFIDSRFSSCESLSYSQSYSFQYQQLSQTKTSLKTYQTQNIINLTYQRNYVTISLQRFFFITHSSHLTNCIYQHQQFRWEVAQDNQSNQPTNQNTNQQPNSQQQGQQSKQNKQSTIRFITAGKSQDQNDENPGGNMLQKLLDDFEKNTLRRVELTKKCNDEEKYWIMKIVMDKENTSVNYIRRIKRTIKLGVQRQS
ncbi:Hypothetical_protein [Hexamita inflata]|uniref:Hypothetical_protein n=1 Tax=Hexamita inflata TaxID=28002 RepID=A0AA86NL54_9EUKA|nr:Hypothetical protein HINF_LOCUS8764 [Hexamita inflata]